MKRNCTNCAFCERFKYSQKDKTEMMRCRHWQGPYVCDHAFIQSMDVAEDYVCDEHCTKEEKEKELFEQAKEDYKHYKICIRNLEEKYPSLPYLKI